MRHLVLINIHDKYSFSDNIGSFNQFSYSFWTVIFISFQFSFFWQVIIFVFVTNITLLRNDELISGCVCIFILFNDPHSLKQ
jgi:hypothetical protein